MQLARNYLDMKARVITIGTVNYRCSEVNCLTITTEETPKYLNQQAQYLSSKPTNPCMPFFLASVSRGELATSISCKVTPFFSVSLGQIGSNQKRK